MPRSKIKKEPVDVVRARLRGMVSAGPVDWNRIPVGTMTEQASLLVHSGELAVITIGRRTHLARV